MRCRDHHTRRGMQISGCKRDGRNRHKNRPDTDPDTVRRKHSGSSSGKHITLDPAVITNCHRRFLKIFLQIISQPLRSLCYGINIYTVCTGTDHTTQAAGTKSKIPIESIFHLCLIHRFQLFNDILIHRRLFHPTLIFFPVIHLYLLHLSSILSHQETVPAH